MFVLHDDWEQRLSKLRRDGMASWEMATTTVDMLLAASMIHILVQFALKQTDKCNVTFAKLHRKGVNKARHGLLSQALGSSLCLQTAFVMPHGA